MVHEKTLSGCVIRLCDSAAMPLAGTGGNSRLYLSASVAHSDIETAGQRSLRSFENRFRVGGRTLLNKKKNVLLPAMPLNSH